MNGQSGLERVKGIEPSYAAWEAAVLPLNYTREVNCAAPNATGIGGSHKVISLILNGQPRQFPAPLSIAALLVDLNLAGKRLAVDRNGEIVPKSHHADTRLADGDTLEIVVAVGGG